MPKLTPNHELMAQVAELERQGLGADLISRQLGAARSTVSYHLEHIRGKRRARAGKVVRYLVLCADPRRQTDYQVCRKTSRSEAVVRAARLNAAVLQGRVIRGTMDRSLFELPLYYVSRELVIPHATEVSA